ncbi:MAG: nucleotide pyrophosphohydrolase [Candidatus Thorarchaeota archaeon]|nr:nucleotide pyrophosphohydrolase [Candidatus Thorarchaeota archaeon]
MPEQKSIDELTSIVRKFVEERNWTKYQRPLPLAISASIEMGELLELFQWLSEDDIQKYVHDSKYIEALSDEIADVMIYLIRLADVTGIDLTEAILSKMKKNRAKYPVDSFSGRIPHGPPSE